MPVAPQGEGFDGKAAVIGKKVLKDVFRDFPQKK
jgi:hypothetical protein